jgi:nitroreductase
MDNPLLSKPVIKYEEPAIETNFSEFRKVVESRRSVRVYDSTPVPEQDVWSALDMALLAPNSSNLQPWEFYWVKDPTKKKVLDEACLGQQAAKTAPVLIVCVARPQHWKKHSLQMLDVLKREKDAPKILTEYYRKIAPIAYGVGPFGMLGFVKWIALTAIGLFKPIPRGPISMSQLREWAVKTTALGCENLMLAFRALGYDSCPMEGFDEVRVKRVLGLKRDATVVMIISAGKRAKHGVYGPRLRFPREQFVKVI